MKPDTRPRIGIYWVFNCTVVGAACSLEEAETSVPGLLDSPFAHVDSWAGIKVANRLPLHLDYDDIPRGRVLYHVKQQKFVVYGDGALLGCALGSPLSANGALIRKEISAFFGFDTDSAVWRHDIHYVVGRQRIDRLLDE